MSQSTSSISTTTLVLITIATVLYLMVSCNEAQAQHSEQPQAQQAGGKVASNSQPADYSDADLFNRLLIARLASREDDRMLSAKKRSNRMIELQNQESNQQQQQQQYHQANKQKLAMKKKWHKLVDDLIDGEFSSDESDSSASVKPDSISSYKRKKWTTSGMNNGGDKIMILMKKPLNFESDTEEGLMKEETKNPIDAIINQLDGAFQRKDGGQATIAAARHPVTKTTDGQQHARRVVDDGFGIMKESMFTTNNHLGFKGVPKFGSEEEY